MQGIKRKLEEGDLEGAKVELTTLPTLFHVHGGWRPWYFMSMTVHSNFSCRWSMVHGGLCLCFFMILDHGGKIHAVTLMKPAPRKFAPNIF